MTACVFKKNIFYKPLRGRMAEVFNCTFVAERKLEQTENLPSYIVIIHVKQRFPDMCALCIFSFKRFSD